MNFDKFMQPISLFQPCTTVHSYIRTITVDETMTIIKMVCGVKKKKKNVLETHSNFDM